MNHSSKASVTVTAIVVALVLVGSTAVNAFLVTATPAYAAKDRVVVKGQCVGYRLPLLLFI